MVNEECFDGFLCRLKQSISKHFHDRFLTDGVDEGKPRFIRADLRSRLLMNLRDGLQPTGSTGYAPGAPASLPARGSWAFAGRDAGAPGAAQFAAIAMRGG